MGILTRAALRGKARQPDPASMYVGFRRNVPYQTIPFDERPINERFQSWDYICINRNSTALSCLPLRCYTERGSVGNNTKAYTLSKSTRAYHTKLAHTMTTDETVEVRDHPILPVLSQPNPILDQMGLIWLTSVYLQLKSVAYWYIRFNQLGQPLQLWPLPSHRVYPVFGGEDVIERYELRYATGS